jgi:flagellar biosynthesis GTPase FlhF
LKVTLIFFSCASFFSQKNNHTIMPPARKKHAISALKVYVLETAEDSALKEATLSNNLEDPWVSWGKHIQTRCFLQCTVHGNTANDLDDVNIWQISQFDPISTPITQVVDLQLCRDLTIYPVIFQPTQVECTAAKIGKIIKAVCRSSSSSGLAEASTVASVAIACSSASAASISISMSRKKTKKKCCRKEDNEGEDEDDEDKVEDEEEDAEEEEEMEVVEEEEEEEEEEEDEEEEKEEEEEEDKEEDDVVGEEDDNDDENYSDDNFIATDNSDDDFEYIEEDEEEQEEKR